MNRNTRLLVAAAAIGGALALSGCGVLGDLLGSPEPVRDAETGEVIEGMDNADVFALRVGDCLNTSDLGEEIESVPVVPCTEPHEDEVYYAFELADGEFPGEDAILVEADATCIAEFADFIGVSYEESGLVQFPLFPTEESWAQGDREVLCLVFDPDALVTGTLAGAAR